MKRLICTILIILMLPITCFALSGCGKDEYNVKNFYNAYKNIANNTTSLELKPADDIYQINNSSYKIDIDYTKSNRLSLLVDDETSQYYNLKHFYQQLLDDSLSPLYFFGETISTKKVNKGQTKQLFSELKALEQEYKDIDHSVGMLINSLNNESNNTTINLAYLKRVFSEYEQAITVANRLSVIVCDVYFSVAISNPNYNYSIKTADQITEADLTRILMDVRTRMYYYKSVYANVYNQIYLRGSNWAEKLSNSNTATPPTYTPYNELKNVKSLENKPMNSLIVNKEAIHANAVALYNLQNSFGTAYNNFAIATNNVEYSRLTSNSSLEARKYGYIIEQFSQGIAVDGYEIISKLNDLLYT